MPKLTIDGQETEVPPGTTVLQAAQGLGIEIAHFFGRFEKPPPMTAELIEPESEF